MISRHKTLLGKLKRELLPQLNPGDQLPTVRSLAKDLKVTNQTITQVLQLLEKEGLIEKTSTTRPYSIPGGSKNLKLPASCSREEDVTKRMIKYVLESDVTKLPSFQDLSQRFGCSLRMIKRCLDVLEKEGWLIKKGRHWEKQFSQEKEKAPILFLTNKQFFIPYQNECNRFRQSFEQLLLKINWPFPSYVTQEEKLKKFKDVAFLPGVIHYHAFKAENFLNWAKSQIEIPVIMVDTSDTLDAGKMPSNVKIISPNHYLAGKRVAQAAIAKGHKSITFLVHLEMDANPWIRARYEGIRDAIRHVDGVELTVYQYNFQQDMPLPDEVFPDRSLQKHFRATGHLPTRLSSYWLHELTNIRCLSMCSILYKPTIKKALENKNSTAWIAVNDNLAIIIQQHLEEEKIKIPDQLALYSFDNSTPASLLEISSYDMGYDKLGALAVNLLLNPGKKSSSRYRVQGNLYERNSSNLQ